MNPQPCPKFDQMEFNNLLTSKGLCEVDAAFLVYLKKEDGALYQILLDYRNGLTFPPLELSENLIKLAIVLESFISKFFGIEDEVAIFQVKTISHNPLSAFKKYYVLRRAKKEFNKLNQFASFKDLSAWLEDKIKMTPLTSNDKELAIALLGMHLLNDSNKNALDIEKLVQWCTHALYSEEGRNAVASFTSFKVPGRIDPFQLVPTVCNNKDALKRLSADEALFRLRDGFELTDPRMTQREVQDEVNYCIYCHDHEGDFCSKGFPQKKGQPELGFKKNALDNILTGCPLEEKISEMNILKRDGHTIAALAMVMLDNPMCPATGHRICNDCMKACIYQKQTPVDIPQIETRTLTDVLNLPFGVEIYDLLTKWNPLRKQQWVMKAYNGLKVLIAGMGPAGFTLAHHLLMEGFAVVGFDGLKIEPLPPHLIHSPIKNFNDLKEALDERVMAGFGGVAEYGITVRWDKNFLKLIYLSLVRRPYFKVYGGIRFGGSIAVQDAWALGFDHFVVAVGAGLPKALPIPYSLAKGMRQANDFLMALQLGNAAKSTSLTALQIRMPAVVIGGGLTGVDTATELQAYYIKQVEKILDRYNVLCSKYSENYILEALSIESKEILNEFLEHGRLVREERLKAKEEGRLPNFIYLIHQWGGVTIAYRRSMQESPAYVNNHEELRKALEEGIFYLEGLEPTSVELDEHQHAKALRCKRRIKNENTEWITTDEEVDLPAKSILVATGTQPNTAYEFEHKGTFNRLNLQYQHYEDIEGELTVAHGVPHCKDSNFGPFTSYHKHHKRVSLIGDTHPVFHGNVVKAIASGMRTYPKILAILKDKLQQKGDVLEYDLFGKKMDDLFGSYVIDIVRRTKHQLELSIYSPLGVKRFKPGQFFRLQNFETKAPLVNNTLLQMEPLALVAASCMPNEGILKFIVNETSISSKLCSILKPNEPVSLMGPTGVRTKIPAEHETILIIGAKSSLPFLSAYGSELKLAGNKVLYLGLFNEPAEIYSQKDIEECTTAIIWVSKSEPILSRRGTDTSINHDDPIKALVHYAESTSKEHIPLADIDRIFVVGDTDLLRRFRNAKNTVLKDYFIKNPKVFGSVYGNMQCMLKGVCAQCLQWQIDPETGQRTKAVFACSWQDQPLEIIDIDHIDARQSQNRAHDELGRLWVDFIFNEGQIDHI